VKLFALRRSRPSRSRFLYRVIPVILALVLAASWPHPSPAASQQNYESLRLLTEALHEISQKYVWKKSEEEIIYGSLRGLMNSLDPDSSFLTPKEYKKLLSGHKGPVAEAGVELVYKDNLLTVVSSLEGGAAWRAGLRPGDHILKINGHLVRNLTTQEASRRFQGKAGTVLNLQVLRNGLVKPLDLSVTLEPLAPGGVTTKILKEHYAYIRIPYFTRETPGKLAAALKELHRHRPPIRGFILDLRNNARGNLDLAVRAASSFIGAKEVVATRGRPPEPNQTYHGRAKDEVFRPGLPLVVLVDGGTARAAEALAGALRDQDQGVLLGSKTMGLCGLTKILPLQDGSALVMTVAQCYTPHGQKIHGKGLEPEVKGNPPAASVSGTTPLAKLSPEKDPWVIQALEILITGKTPKLAEKAKAK
jgi:carboxyl-terminal processing protease